ncbi:MAG: hypothetical protein ACRESX_08990 [Gammaproteobacteria bacterium]
MNTQAMTFDPPAPLPAEAQGIINQALKLCTGDKVAVIQTAETAHALAADLAVVKGAYKRITDLRISFTRPLDDLKKRWMTFFEKPLQALSNREEDYKGALGDWAYREKERVAKERREAEEAARKEREKLERAQARAAERAEAKGDQEKADAIRNAPQPIVAPPPVIEAQKPQGVATYDVYKAECRDLMALVKAVAAGTAPIELIQVNQSTLNKLAGVLKSAFKLAGCVLQVEQRVRSGSV